MKYYYDCSCSQEHWKEFSNKEEAEKHFQQMACEEKILYDEEFKTLTLFKATKGGK